ncbi:MAG TPA: exodeoxyribonuclease VII large subunit [Candidatus Methylomirabilis sp.]|nr:exodeoxyribonuclease VII large subunit [Candidatus Methylomirabilis sp.]
MAERPVFTVSELTARIKGRLEDAFPALWVEGEISNLRSPSSGHAYFTLKDDLAQLRCVLFRNRGRRVRFALEDGLQVLVFGGLEVYAARGEYQLVAELIEPKGLGALQLAFEQLKKKLEAEGLFDQARKRPLPRFPRTIGIVTSPTGAALRDMLHIIGRRYGDLRVVVAPVRVQGDGAAVEIVRAFRDLAELQDLDVVIVGRGGGSIEDLWAFNDERVARAIAASPTPVISAVGHETDFTIADFVADLRAPTPSGAAELVVREKLAVIRALVEAYDRLQQAVRARTEQHRHRVASLARRRVLIDPARALRDWHRRVDELVFRLRAAARTHHRGAAHRVALLTNTLSSLHPLARISHGRAVLTQLRGRLVSAGDHRLKVSRHRFETSVGRLESLSPLAVLGRGYSLTRLASGVVVRRAAETQPGAVIEILLHEGSLDARVERVRERDERHHV